MVAAFIMIKVRGFIRPEMEPTLRCIRFKVSFSSEKDDISSFSFLKALMTLTPSKFSPVLVRMVSRADWTFLYMGMVMTMMPKTTIESTGIVTTKIRAAFTFTVKAMIMAPKTMKGERRKRRRVMLTPAWAWLISLVIRVIRVELPRLSSFEKERLPICSKTACLSLVEKPTAAFAEKYWAVREEVSPMTARRRRIRHILPI